MSQPVDNKIARALKFIAAPGLIGGINGAFLSRW
jgi:hypothetical protein